MSRIKQDSVFTLRLAGHHRPYRFDRIAEAYGAMAAQRLMQMWVLTFQFVPSGTVEQAHSVLVRTLCEMRSMNKSKPTLDFSGIFEDLINNTGPLDGRLWEKSIRNYLSEICPQWNRATNKTLSKRNNVAYTFNSMLAALEDRGHCLDFQPIRGLRGGRKKPGKVATLGQLRRCNGNTEQEGYVPLEESGLIQIEHSRAILEELKTVLLNDLKSMYEKWKIGQGYISMYSDLGEIEAERMISKPRVVELLSKDTSSSSFLKMKSETLPALIFMIKSRYNDDIKVTAMPNRYRLLIEKFGGITEILKYIRPNGHAANAISGLIICDTGFNPSVVSDLPENPFLNKESHGKTTLSTIAARKRRAKGKVVYGLIEGQEAQVATSRKNSLNTCDAIAMYREMTSEIRTEAKKSGQEDASKKLIIYGLNGGYKIGQFSNDASRFSGNEWRDFLNRHERNEIIGGLKINRATIRKTVLQLSYFDNDADISIAQALAGHEDVSTTFDHYLNAPWMAKAIESHIRHFMNLLEVAIAPDVNWEAFAGVSSILIDQRKAEADDLGLSFYCSDKDVDVSQLARTGPSCTPLDPCPHCPVRRFAPSMKAFRSLAIAQIALDLASERISEENPKRWYAVWLPWHALVIAYHRRLKRSPYRFDFEQVSKAVAAEFKEGLICLPEIF
ncbi:hypothetical protein LL253_14310 [Sphingobium soli]|uniref:Tyr recombinase domain-containing protein n=1 Tax=Sphingobium soli TaxID=1591116 RepID=A0ABS8H5Z1_9SPHN|nr:hypothetical protein [Sphingobium soli]MCC4233854.1 hypothetical protein [Sphingobium soli]